MQTAVDDVRDEAVTLTGDDRLGVVVAIALARGDELLHARCGLARKVELGGRLGIALEELNGEVATANRVDESRNQSLDLGEHIFDRAVKRMMRTRGVCGGDGLCHAYLGAPGGLARHRDEPIDTVVLERRDHHDRTTQALLECGDIDLVAILLNQISHVERHHHGQACLDDLQREIEVALQIGGVEHLNHDVGLAAHEVVAAHALLGAVGRQRIDSGQVRDEHALVARQGCLLLLDRDAGPVAHITVGTGDQVEQRGLAAIGVTGKRDVQYWIRHAILLFSWL